MGPTDDKSIHDQDVKVLHDMGYAQELSRRMGGFQNFAISFSIICILSGGINSLGQATAGAGGAAIGFGWPLGCLMSFMFALALAQIGSAYPTAGGLYHWGSILGNRFTGWLSAWLNLLGLITVLGAINVGTWYFLFGAFGPMLGLEDTITQRVGFVALITVVQALFNHFGIGLTVKLTDLAGYIIFAGAIALTLVCLAFAPSWDVSRLFTWSNFTGTAGASAVWPDVVSAGMAFTLGLLLPVYTITGYDASAHTAEETKNAAVALPKGMVSAVIWSSLFGYLMLCAFVLMIPAEATVADPADATKSITVPGMQAAAMQGWNVFFWAMEQQVPAGIRQGLYGVIFVSQFLCGLATVTSVSRMLYAFSRDGGIPGVSGLLAKVSPTWRTPVNAIWFGSLFSVLFVWATSSIEVKEGVTAYSVVVSCTVIFLFLSFALPIFLGMIAYGGPKWPNPGPWSMGGALFRLVALLSLVSMGVIFFAGVQPPNSLALPITVGFVALSLLIWLLFENRRFKGPPVGDEIARRQAEIKAQEAALGGAG